MLYGKIYQWAQSQAYHHLPVAMVSCPACGADVDQQCSFNGRRGVVPHADRRTALRRLNKSTSEAQAEYEQFRLDVIEHYVKIAIQELAPPVPAGRDTNQNGDAKDKSPATE